MSSEGEFQLGNAQNPNTDGSLLSLSIQTF